MEKQLFKVRPALQIEATEEPLIAGAGLVLPYEMAKPSGSEDAVY